MFVGAATYILLWNTPKYLQTTRHFLDSENKERGKSISSNFPIVKKLFAKGLWKSPENKQRHHLAMTMHGHCEWDLWFSSKLFCGHNTL